MLQPLSLRSSESPRAPPCAFVRFGAVGFSSSCHFCLFKPLSPIPLQFSILSVGIILKQLPNIVPGPWEFQLRCLMGGVLTAGVCILGLHALICERAKELGWGNIGRTAAARTAAASGSGVAAAVRQRIGLRDTFKLLAASPQMLCLAAMSVSQGLSSNVFQARLALLATYGLFL